MMFTNPVVSVLITAYNRGAYIGESIESVLRSTFQDFELIVVDDASEDDTVAISREYERTDSRVRVYQNQVNLGDYPNRNEAARWARGEYLKYVDSDDVIYPHGLEVMVECMKAFPEAGFGLSEIGDVHGPCPRLLQPRESFREHFLVADLFGRAPGSAIIRRRSFEAVGGFSGMPYVGDQATWLKMGRAFCLVKMPRDLYWDRTHGLQESVYEPAETVALRRSIALEALAAPDCPLTAEERQRAILRIGDGYARTFWSLVVRRQGGMGPLKYKQCLGLSTSQIARFAFSRLLSAAGVNSGGN
jgi:glycosyltransferase involved in cell wall biosynthesis